MADKKDKKPAKEQAMNNQQRIPSEEEQLMRRQSAPRPTAESEAQRLLQLQQEKMLASQGVDGNGAVNGIKTVRAPIGEKEVSKLNATLRDYKRGKHSLEQRIVENEEWYKLRHWECMRREKNEKKDEIEPVSAWLVNCILNKHADAMDNFPAPNILPREESDKGEAQMLSSIVPVVLEQNDFEQTYSDNANYKLKNGTSVYGVFWDSSKLNGLGDISIKKIDDNNYELGVHIADVSYYVKEGTHLDEEAYARAKENAIEISEPYDNGLPDPVNTPSQLDVIEAQVTYTAMMTDTLLEV
jgi:hypothetical protein